MSRADNRSPAKTAVIAGVGYSTFSRNYEGSIESLALTAIDNALADCGLKHSDVDGLLTYHLNDSVSTATISRSLALPKLRWNNEYYGGGSQCCSILWDAAQAIEHGLADTIVIYRAMKGRSGKRMGQLQAADDDGIESQFLTPYGSRGPINTFALTAQRWLQQRDHKPEQLSSVVLQQREYASRNKRAIQQKELSLDDYLASPMISSPLRRLDCCQETDAACALVITRADRGQHLQQANVRIHSAYRGGFGDGIYPDKTASLDTIFSSELAQDFYRHAGVNTGDIDLAYFYDAYSFLVPIQLEDFGFCARGEALDFIANGGTKAHGPLPINSHGGLLSEGYVHGLNNIAETVLQLRGNQGDRQVKLGNGMALCTGFGGRFGSAALLLADAA